MLSVQRSSERYFRRLAMLGVCGCFTLLCCVFQVLKKLSSTFSAEESSTDGKKISLMDKMLTRIVKKRRSNTEGVAGGDGAENNNDDDDDGRHSVNDNNKDFDVEITDEESS